MLKFSTEIKTLDVIVDGQTYNIPLEPTVQDFSDSAQLFSSDKTTSEEFSRWFLSFLKRYIPDVESLPMSALGQIMQEWSKKSSLTKDTAKN